MEKIFPNSIAKVMIPIVHIAHECDVILDTMLCEKHNLTLADFKILMAVHAITDCTQADVSRYKNVSEAAVSKQVRQLVADQLLYKETHPADARKTVLRHTPKGERLVHRLVDEVTVQMDDIFADLSEAERTEMARSLARMFQLIIAHSPDRKRHEGSKDSCVQEMLSTT